MAGATYAALGLVVGLPLGVAAGRWLWNLFAQQIGVVPEPVTPVPLVLLVVPSAVLLANVVAAIPALVATRGPSRARAASGVTWRWRSPAISHGSPHGHLGRRRRGAGARAKRPSPRLDRSLGRDVTAVAGLDRPVSGTLALALLPAGTLHLLLAVPAGALAGRIRRVAVGYLLAAGVGWLLWDAATVRRDMARPDRGDPRSRRRRPGCSVALPTEPRP